MSTFELKLTFTSADALYAAVAKLAGEAPAVVQGLSATPAYASPVIPVTVVEAPLPAKPARAGRPKKAAEPEAVVSAATGAAEQDPAPVVEAVASQATTHLMPTGDEVKSAAEAVNAKVGIVGLKKLLAKYNAARISEIAPENRAAFIADCQQVA